MKNYLIFGTVFLTLIFGYFIFTPNNNYNEGNNVPVDTNTQESMSREMGVSRNAELGYEFSYPDSLDGYVMLENNDSNDTDFVSGLTLVNRVEYDAFKAYTESTEGPAAISLRMYTNPENLNPSEWAAVKSFETNYDLAFGNIEEVNVDGANSLHFVTEGLYQIDTYVIVKGRYVYLLTGAYIDTNSEIYKDYQALVASFNFTTDARLQGRINVQEVCREALAYMTFSTAEDVDKFIAECVNGDHSEVIERFIKETGLDGAI